MNISGNARAAEIDISPDGFFVLIADAPHHVIRKVEVFTASMIFVAGTYVVSCPAHSTLLDNPQGVMIHLYASSALKADTNNHVINFLNLIDYEMTVLLQIIMVMLELAMYGNN